MDKSLAIRSHLGRAPAIDAFALKERFGVCHMTGRLACQLVVFLGEEPEYRPRIAADLKAAGSLAIVTVVALLSLYLLFLGMRRKS
jgi:hypothetical protein